MDKRFIGFAKALHHNRQYFKGYLGMRLEKRVEVPRGKYEALGVLKGNHARCARCTVDYREFADDFTRSVLGELDFVSIIGDFLYPHAPTLNDEEPHAGIPLSYDDVSGLELSLGAGLPESLQVLGAETGK